jgi:hypothetical protein
VHKINIANTKHAITEIRIADIASPRFLDHAAVFCPACWFVMFSHAPAFGRRAP